MTKEEPIPNLPPTHGDPGWSAPIAVALILAVAASWIDFHTDEPTVLCGFVLVFGAACGAAFGLRRAWLCALLIGACLPLYYSFAHVLLHAWPHWPPHEIGNTNWATLITTIPGLIGVMIGNSLRAVVGSAGRSRSL
jgi:hypothetical protein